MTLQTDNDRVIASIRANIVFEKLIVSVLTVAGAASMAYLLIGLGWRALAGGLSASAAATTVIDAVRFACVFFLAGFVASLAIGIPLFRWLERAKIRRVAPYALAAFAVSFAFLAAAGSAPSFEAPARALYLVPGIAAALLFGRKMRPFWLAADRADAAAPGVTRIH
ncbi:MAG: hypothetical protein A3E78_04840 [Alphaproteobacteria bacterium RIFCSPHIGHO2_12_FULL_63_12]|nr:MAG: hypothetical protein A3E78_04840 [Alphaproteobacteria bacterium RIFCSPHIGHO2_12_FULL_63_12]